jgi:hypothetical protein
MRHGASLAQACRSHGIKPSTFRRYVGEAVRQDRVNGRVRVAPTDRFTRILQIPGPRGRVRAVAKGSEEARELSHYLNALATYARSGKTAELQRFEGKTFRTESGERVPFVTDVDALDELAEAGSLHVDQLYATLTSSR